MVPFTTGLPTRHSTRAETDRSPRPAGGDRPFGVSVPTGLSSLAQVFLTALAFVLLTRWPVARLGPVESDEFGYLETVSRHALPMHHTLFLAAGRVLGRLAGDPYAGFLWLDMIVSALALAAAWWWLRAVVSPARAVAATALLAVGPVFWGYGAMAGNYTAVVLVGSVLLGVVARTFGEGGPRPWHAYLGATALAVGAGYRQDIGTFWLPVLGLILWRCRGRHALGAFAVFGVLNLMWFVPMLAEAGGWARYRAASAEFSREAGYKNSIFYLGFVDAPLRYALKLGMALVWTLGPALLLAPAGVKRLWDGHHDGGRWLLLAMTLAAVPALGLHLLIHFGVPGYAFHYVPALLGLAALGAGPPGSTGAGDRGVVSLAGCAGLLAAAFLFYPADFNRPGFRGNFDLSFARHTRVGLAVLVPGRGPSVWRTRNSKGLTHGAPAR